MESLPDDIFLSALSSVAEAVMITDAELNEPGPRILYVNRAFKEMTGYDLNEIYGCSPRFLQGPDTNRAVLDRARKALAAVEAFQGQVTNYRKNGTPFIVEWRIVPYKNGSDKPKYFISFQREITEELKTLQHTEQLELIQHVSKEITSEGLNLDSVRQRVADVAMEITGAEAVVVEEPEEQNMVYRAVAGRAKGNLGLRLRIDQSLSGLCYRTEKTLNCKDSQTDERIRLKEKAQEIGFRSAILAPLLHLGRCYGVLKVYSSNPHNFTVDDQRLIELSSDILAAALFDAASSYEDLFGRQRNGVPVSFLMLDIDKFKRVNDKYGHAAGDEVLKGFAQILFRSVRRTDVFCRWGGEEFSILLNESDIDSARGFAERLLESIRSCDFGRMGKITASIGIAEAVPEENLKSLQKRADSALYRAKEEGRDRAAVAE